MRRQCPKGYQMINGNCQQAISNQLTPGDTSIIGTGNRTACVAACEMWFPFQDCSSYECNCSCCHTYHWTGLDGQHHSHCECGGCYGQFMQCIAGCMNPSGGFKGSVPSPGGGRYGWRRGGKIKRRRRR